MRAVASGRRRGEQPRWRRVELRYVDLKAGRRLQVTAYDDTQAHVSNHEDPAGVLDELLAEPFANWHVETTTETHQLRVTKKGRVLLHSSARTEQAQPQRAHDQVKDRLLPEDHPRAARARHLRPAGTGQAVAPGEVPPGRGVPAGALGRDRRRGPDGPATRGHGRRAAPGRGPRLWQRLPDLRRPRLAARADARAPGRRGRQGAVPPPQHRGRRAARGGRRDDLRGRGDR